MASPVAARAHGCSSRLRVDPAEAERKLFRYQLLGTLVDDADRYADFFLDFSYVFFVGTFASLICRCAMAVEIAT